MLLTAFSAWTMCFQFSPFSMFLYREMGSAPSWEGQWLDTELQDKQEAHTKQPASPGSLSADLGLCHPPHIPLNEQFHTWEHFQVGFCCRLNDQQESQRLGLHRHIHRLKMVGNKQLSFTQIFAVWVSFAYLPTHTPCSWIGLPCTSLEKMAITTPA